MIVFDDADLGRALDAVIFMIYSINGERCTSSSRLLVQDTIREAFEAILLQSLVRRMREAQLRQGFFGESAGSSVYEAMFEQHLAEAISENSPLGIADILENRWSETLEGREKARDLLHKAAQVSLPYADIEK